MSDIVTRLRTYKDGGGLNAWDEAANLIEEQQEEIERLKEDLKRYHPESWARITKRLTDERDEREEAARWLWHRVERPESDKQVIYKRYPWLEE